ncbi:MAG: threonylcarbamoyl-AMP synthase [Myxococcales bacterium]|nr:threonylcarbamoyl-AMP synthase [Myxococcales bacterium]
MEYFDISPYAPRPDLVHQLVTALKAGELVACPTDTTFGVFASLEAHDAPDKLRDLRMRMAGSPDAVAAKSNKPLALLFSDLTMLAEFAVMSALAFKVSKRLLPGPYTIVLPATREVPKRLQTKRRHIGARIPDSDLVRQIVEGLGCPLLSTTAKTPDGELVHDPSEIAEHWFREVNKVVDTGGFYAEPSTVIAVDEKGVEVFREGKGSLEGL